MNIPDLIAKIQNERKSLNSELYSPDGLLRLQQVAAAYDGEYKLIWSDDLLNRIKSRPTVATYPSKLSKLDTITGGFREQQLISISAHTKHGKTAFGIFLMQQLENLQPVMIPLEQSAEELVEQRYENGQYLPRFLSPERLAAHVTVDWIEQRVVEGIAKHNTKFILVDHLGYIDDFGEQGRFQRENLAYRIGVVMQGLKNIAKRWNVIIAVLVHIAQTEENKPPTLKDLKGSSSIAQESDLVLMLWRKNHFNGRVKVYENKTLVSVQANRRKGTNGNIGLDYDVAKGTYTQSTDGWVEAMEETADQSDLANGRAIYGLSDTNHAR